MIPAWAHGYTDLSNPKHVFCRYCEQVIKGGGITGLKEHLVGRAKKRQLSEEIGNPYGTPMGDANEDDFEMDEVEIFTNPTTTTTGKGKEKVSQTSTQNKRRGVSNTPQHQMPNFFAPRMTTGSQPDIKSTLATKEQKDATDLVVGCWLFDATISFSASR